MTRIITGTVLTVLWLYLLHVLKKAKLNWWRFLAGSMGLFILMMVFVQPIVTEPLAKCVCALSGFFGTVTRTFFAYFKYGIIYVPAATGSVTLAVDLECAGIIEIMAFLSLLLFFDLYSRAEKLVIGVMGTCIITFCNAVRIIMIAEAVHFFGMQAYYIVHTFIGRIFFYFCSVLLYFYVFTKPQVMRMKVGNFSYGHSKTNA